MFKFLKDSDVKGVIGLFFLLGITSVYLYFNPGIIDENKLAVVQGKVADKPYHDTHSDGPDYISVDIIGYKKSFKIKGCVLWSISKTELLNLNLGDQVQFYVLKNELNEEIVPLIDSSVIVYGIEINGKQFVALEEFNECQKFRWKRLLRLLPFLLIVLALVVYPVIKK